MSNFDRVIISIAFGLLFGAVIGAGVWTSLLIGAVSVVVWFGCMILLVKAAGNE